VILDSILRRGAKGVESLDMAYRSFEQFSSYNVERDNSLKPYVALVYVIMALYVLLSSIIAYMLVPQVNRISAQIGGGAAGISLPTVDSEAFPILLEYSIIIQSIIAGIIIGLILYNNSIAGLLHGGLLMVVLTVMNYALLMALGGLVG
jgi:flagellar protein FlaJ